MSSCCVCLSLLGPQKQYKCPRCQAKYCSLACCNEHKKIPCTAENLQVEEEKDLEILRPPLPMGKVRLERIAAFLAAESIPLRVKEKIRGCLHSKVPLKFIKRLVQEDREFAEWCSRVLEIE